MSRFQAVFFDFNGVIIDDESVNYLNYIKNGVFVFPGVETLIQALAGEVWLGLVSGAPRQEIDFILRKIGLFARFDVVVSANDVAFSKPHPEGYLKALDGVAALAAPTIIDPSRCLVIEDSLAGIAAAHGAGMRCLAVATSYPAALLRKADWVCERLEGIRLDELGV